KLWSVPGSSSFRCYLAASCAMLVSACALAQSPSGRVTAVRYWSLGEITRIAIEIEADGEFHFRSDQLENPDRLFFDVVGASPQLGHKGIRVIPVSDRFMKQIRIAETQRYVTRVVLDLESPVEYTTSQLENPSRLMIEVHAAGFRPTPVKADVE